MDANLKRILKALSLELRHLLEGEYGAAGQWHTGDLERHLNALGVWRDRAPLPADELPPLTPADREARDVVDAYLALRRDAGIPRDQAVAEFVRETAYTWANRLLALRCMEARELIDEVILQKPVYGGRSLEHHRLARRHPELCVGEDDGLFAVLGRAFERQARHLPLLFDPHAPAVALQPSVAALKRAVALLSGTESVKGQEAATDEIFKAPDALGWAYQYWNTEEKDRVFERVRTQEGAKIEGADIVPATQLYTEPYMVKFLVQNSLSALWMGMYPESRLYERWEYHVRDADRAPVHLKPVREITFLDPAGGSGHFLLEAFDLLYDMYLEEGEITDPEAICASILQNNLFGIDIDERAVQIAEAALWMKAAERASGFQGAPTNLVATNIHLPKGKDHLEAFLAKYPEDAPLRPALELIFEGLEHADELGSLLQIEEPVEQELRRLQAQYVHAVRRGVQIKMFEPTPIQGELPLGVESYEEWKAAVLARLKAHFAAEAQVADLAQYFFNRSAGKGLVLFDLLARRYDVVAANPPYMGSGNMGPVLKKYVERHYTPGKRDLYAAFVLCCQLLTHIGGRLAMVTQQSWMFLHSFSNLRAVEEEKLGKLERNAFKGLLREASLETIAHLGPGAFGEISGEVVNTALFTLANVEPDPEHRLTAFRLVGPKSAEEKDDLLREALTNNAVGITFHPIQAKFLSVIKAPLCYWLRERVLDVLSEFEPMAQAGYMGWGISSSNNARFLRWWWEAQVSNRWLRHAKGGTYGRWAGLVNHLVDWDGDGVKLKEFILERYPYLGRNYEIKIRPYTFGSFGWTYSSMSRGCLGARLLEPEHTTNAKSPALFLRDRRLDLGAVLNSRVASYVLRAIAPTLNVDEGYVGAIPVPPNESIEGLARLVSVCVALKRSLVAQDLANRWFTPRPYEGTSIAEVCFLTIQQVGAAAAALHTLEGISEHEVFCAYGIAGDDLAAVLNETGAPAGWFALAQGYDVLPALPVSLSEPITRESEFLEHHGRRVLSPQELTELKHRLHALYKAGPGVEVEDDAVTANSDDKEEGVVGAHIPIPVETFLEELSQKLKIHPISVYWLLKEGIEQEGWRCLPEEQRITADHFTVIILRLLGHRWPRQIEAGEPVPDWADADGIIPLTEATGEPTLLERVRERITEEFDGGDVTAIEREFEEIMGKSLGQWLTAEFFQRHISQFKKRPIAWQIQSSRFTARQKPAFACLLYYHKLDGATLATIQSQYVRPLRQRYETELRGIESIPAAARSARQDARRVELEAAIHELRDFDAALEQVATQGFASQALEKIVAQEPLDRWCSIGGVKPPPEDREALLRQEQSYIPDINDGVRVNVAPMQKAGLLAANVLAAKDVDQAIADRAEWRADERRWCREGKLPQPGWWE